MELQQIDVAPFSFELSLAYDCPGLVLQDLYQDAIRRFQASTHYRSSSAMFKPFKPWNFEWKQKKTEKLWIFEGKVPRGFLQFKFLNSRFMMAARSWIRVQTSKNKQKQSADCKGGITHTIFGVPLWSRKENLYLKSSAKKRSKKKGVTLFLHGQLALAAVNQPQIHSLLRLLRQRLW